MDTEKKGFVLYVDMLENLQGLTHEQLGRLLLVLFDFAKALAEEREDQAAALQRHPELDPAAGMAFKFIANAIRRDTQVWRQKHERYQQAAMSRAAERRARTMGEDAWDYVRRDT